MSAPTYDRIAQVIIERLSEHDPDEGLDTVDPLLEPVGAVEAQRFGLPAGTAIPASIIRKVKRCVNETPEGLIESGLISSGDTLARILPQMTSGIRAAGLADPSLRRLYAALYRAFRRRRSLLLLNLEKQVQMGELPWIAAMEEFRSDEIGSQDVARQALEEITVTAMTSFPHAILPNKLLQELRALVKGAGLDIPIVDELAADIFMGKFTVKFRESAKVATELLSGTLYSTYYEIDHQTVHRLPSANKPPVRTWFGRATQTTGDPLAALCASRAGVALGTRDAATNGMVIEQQQILTTQNLAVLFRALGLRGILEARLAEMAKMCFRWICRRHRMKVDSWHARLIRVKNTAHAWRQMVFFLSMAHESDLDDFLRWAEEHLELQPDPFRQRFRPALRGLLVAAAGSSIDQEVSRGAEIRRFTGWSKTRHWLLVEG